MAAPSKKQSLFDWFASGKASFPSQEYSFWAGAISFADTSATAIVPRKKEPSSTDSTDVEEDEGNWALPDEIYGMEKVYNAKLQSHLTPPRKNVLGFLKWIDVGIQIFSGTLLFGVIQNAGEWLRAAYKDETGFIAGAAKFVGGAIAMLGRAGLFVTQILAGAIRLPFAILSGTVGLIRGLAAKNDHTNLASLQTRHFSKSHLILAHIGDFLWPFAPKAARLVSMYLPEKDMESLSPKDKESKERQAAQVRKSTASRWISILSFALAITLVALLATGTLGIGGFAALPVIKPIAGAIALALNHAFGWAGLHVAFHGVGVATSLGTSAPVLSGIANWLSLGIVPKKVVMGTMLVGALSTFFSNIFNTFKENVFMMDSKGTGSRGSLHVANTSALIQSERTSSLFEHKHSNSSTNSSTVSVSTNENNTGASNGVQQVVTNGGYPQPVSSRNTNTGGKENNKPGGIKPNNQ